MRKILGNLLALAVSTGIGLILCEIAARMVLNPADYLSVEMVLDPVLGAVPSAATKSGGFDAWGFRNRDVPSSADIVAIGDSHTYGNTATMDDSWPYVLARLSGKRVYNMGLGGYGPNQYYTVFKNRALGLHPRTIVCGLYMGDDFENAFLITYGLDHWAYLRELSAEKVNFDIWENPPAPTWHKKVRLWLSRHSVTYQLIVHGALAARTKGDVQIRNAAQLYDGATTLRVPEKKILEAFLPRQILRRLDQNSTSVREGMRITFKLLDEMHAASQKSNIDFQVVVIPTKEMVFAEYLDRDRSIPLSDVVLKLLENERVAREKVFAFLSASGIPAIDPLPRLRQAVDQELYARGATDMHPNKNGYRVIGEIVHEALQQREKQR